MKNESICGLIRQLLNVNPELPFALVNVVAKENPNTYKARDASDRVFYVRRQCRFVRSDEGTLVCADLEKGPPVGSTLLIIAETSNPNNREVSVWGYYENLQTLNLEDQQSRASLEFAECIAHADLSLSSLSDQEVVEDVRTSKRIHLRPVRRYRDFPKLKTA